MSDPVVSFADVPERVVFVCSGNTCRSPLAEVLARSLLRASGLELEVCSAGLEAAAGMPAAAAAREVARGAGLSLDAHRSKPVDAVPGGAGTLWITMTSDQAAALAAQLGRGAWVEPLLPLARRHGARVDGRQVEDPAAAGEEAYLQVFGLLRAALEPLVAAWAVAAAHAHRGMQTKTLALPRLDGLRPTLESTALKLLEEAGELAENIGKYRALSGERRSSPPQRVMTAIGQELLDVAQTAITMMFVLEEQYGVGLQELLHEHVRKLAAKGYLGPGGPDAQAADVQV